MEEGEEVAVFLCPVAVALVVVALVVVALEAVVSEAGVSGPEAYLSPVVVVRAVVVECTHLLELPLSAAVNQLNGTPMKNH